MMVNKDNIAAMSSLKWGPAAKWLVRGQINNAIQAVNLNPKGTETFNNTYNIASGSLLNMFGTTDTTVTKETEAGFGKTPQALQMQAQRENTRDAADRFYMEQFVSSVCKKMVNLTTKKLNSSISIRMFQPEIEKMAQDYPEIQEMYDEKSGKLTINKSKLANTLYDYEIVSGSSYAVDQKTQQDSLAALIELFNKNPQLIQIAAQEGYTIKIGEMIKRIIANTGIQDWNKIIEEMPQDQKDEQLLNNDAQQFMQAVQQMQGVNQVPPQPGQPGMQAPPQAPGQPMGGQGGF